MITLLIAILLSALCYLRGKRKISSLLLRSLLLVALFFLFYPPKLNKIKPTNTPNAPILLIDNSISMGDEALKNCEDLAKELKAETTYFSSPVAGFTDFEHILTEISLKLQSQIVHICSDGQETKGNYKNALPLLVNQEIQIKPIYPDARLLSNYGIKLTSFKLPTKAFQGEKIPCSFTLENLTEQGISDSISILVDSKEIKKIDSNVYPFKSDTSKHILEPLEPGKHKVTLRSNNSPQTLSKWIYIEEHLKPLILHSDERESLLLRKIYPILGTKPEHILINNKSSLPSNLNNYSSIILNDLSANKLDSSFIEKLKEHLSKGRKLVILGGDSSFGLGNYINSPLKDLSPLLPVPPRAKVERLPSAVLLVVDKSGSMAEQGKIMSARLAALSSIESLKDDDYVGVIGFDSGPIAVIELGLVKEVKPEARARLQGNLQAKGHTNLLPALSLARLRLSNVKAGRKHIIVLSDGQIPQSGSDDFVRELNRIKSEKITISTVALGYEADVPFMKMVAQQGRGSFYQTLDPSRLPKLFVDDIKVSVGEDTISEQSSYEIQKGPSGLISVDTSLPPFLGGFIETKLRDGANLELITKKGEETFPILASMNYGKGRSIALATDLQGRWSKTWLKWPELVRFVGDLTGGEGEGKGEGLGDEGKYDFRYTLTGNNLKIEFYLYDKPAALSRKTFNLDLSTESKSFSKQLELKEESLGLYTTEVELKESGDYFLNGQVGSLNIKDLGISIGPEDLGEVRGLGINFDLLEDLRRSTKREKKEAETASLDADGDRYLDTINLLYLCMGLLVLEVFVRERKR